MVDSAIWVAHPAMVMLQPARILNGMTALDTFLPNLAAYTSHAPLVPVRIATSPGCLHRFFDTSPISPSGRYLAALRMPDESRLNTPGEAAEVVLVDLHSGDERVVAHTCGWEAQMGANINWGADDHHLVFNDVDTSTWQSQLVVCDPLTGSSEKITGGVYHVSPDGRYAAASCMEAMRRTQTGYGVMVPDDKVPLNRGAPDDDGMFITDLSTGERTLAVSLADAAKVIPDLAGTDLERWHIHGFHCKWSGDGSRLIFTVRRWRSDGEKRRDFDNIGQDLRFDVLTCKPDGSELSDAVPAICWKHGGHHINWLPDGSGLSMNLGGFGDRLRFVRCDIDGSHLRPILLDSIGSGHPTVTPCGHILTDSYTREQPFIHDDGTTPLRWVNIASGVEREAVRMTTVVAPGRHGALRIDPHPAWDRSGTLVSFNASISGKRHVLIANFSELLG
ncbi:MAG: hypothetical protein PF961_15855 [Planctomycetota bacterium]|jgi:hypothetical protein|nr:hypothetical protein [Planctomycetota bacterium]